MDGRIGGQKFGYMPGLDGIRAVAVLLVMACHAKVPALVGGFLGVDIFFVLSGYLISTLLLQEIDQTGQVKLTAFWRRRMVRLFPAMAVLVAAFLCAAPWLGRSIESVIAFSVASLLYLTDYLIVFTGSSIHLGHLWSLAVEAKFYIIWPCLLVVCARSMQPRSLAWGIFLLAVAATAWRIFNAQMVPWEMVYYRFDTRLSGLLAGSALAAAMRAGWRPTLPCSAGFLCIALAPLLSRQFADPDMLTWIPITVELATVLLILAVQEDGPIARALASRPMIWLGGLSYGIYLWHYPIMRILRDEAMHWAVVLLIGAATSFALAWLSLHTIERWARRYRTPPHSLNSATARPTT